MAVFSTRHCRVTRALWGVRGCDAVLSATAWSYLLFAYAAHGIPHIDVSVCPWRFMTGSPCPLCGSTHFIGDLLHGTRAIGDATLPWLVWLVAVVAVGIMSSVTAIRAER